MIFCQKCKAANSSSQQYCAQCGTRLMITVSPRSVTNEPGSSNLVNSFEEHLLERISALEYSLLRMQERFDRVLDILHKQATTSFTDHTMLDSLIDLLDRERIVNREELETLWQQQLSNQVEQSTMRELFETRREKILLASSDPSNTTFARLIFEGFRLFIEGDHKRGSRNLEKASLLDPKNVELNFFLGEYFYYHEKPALAETYLQRAVDRDPKHYRAILMLGIVCGDEGKVEMAKTFLENALKLRKDSFAAHYGLGQILASEGNLDAALVHFKQALVLKPSPEMYFLVGYAYLERGEMEPALKHLRKAVDLDPKFDVALYHLGLIYLKRKLVEKAREHFKAAYEINPTPRYRSALRARSGSQLPHLPVFGRASVTRRRTLTQGDSRLAKLLRNDLLQHVD